MSSYPKPSHEKGKFPEEYPAEFFIDFLMKHGFTIIEDTEKFTRLKNAEAVEVKVPESKVKLQKIQLSTLISAAMLSHDDFRDFLNKKHEESFNKFIELSQIKFKK